jgi:hypothetical protein
MAMLGRHKWRRQNTHQHGCNNRSGKHGGDNPTLKEDGDSSSLDASFALNKSSPTSSANQQQEQDHTNIPVEAAGQPTFSPPQTSLNKKAMNTAPQRKSVGSSTEQQKVLAEFTEEKLLGFLAFLRRENSKTHSTNGKNTNKSTADPSLHYNNQYIEFEKLSEFTLDFDSFSYKINEFGRKTKQDSWEAICQAE